MDDLNQRLLKELAEDDALLDRIEKVRAQNNRAWMDLLRLALEAEPQRAKAILLNIKRNDSEIQRLLGELASG